LKRPGLERLRDAVASGLVDRLYVHSPDRLARRYAYQVLLIDGVRWTPSVRQLGWRVKRESRGIIAPCRCRASVLARAAG
jgi:hypothetical protein